MLVAHTTSTTTASSPFAAALCEISGNFLTAPGAREATEALVLSLILKSCGEHCDQKIVEPKPVGPPIHAQKVCCLWLHGNAREAFRSFASAGR